MMKLEYNVTRDTNLLETTYCDVVKIINLTILQNVKVGHILFLNLTVLIIIIFTLDVNECAASQCDVASTECVNTPGSFHCKCRKGFAPTLECRPVGDLGMINGGIPDESITVSSSEVGYEKSVITLYIYL